MHPLVGVLIAYAAGSLPAAYLAGKAAGVDLRTKGSGNLGATNVVRVLGFKVGLGVFLVDMIKGALPVWLLPAATTGAIPQAWLAILYGAVAILGHVRPVWLRFGKGGKGVATACGVFLALAPVPTLLALAAFVTVLVSAGYVSLASLAAAAALPPLVAVQLGVGNPVFAVSVVIASFVFWTHRPNMARLRSGEEHHFARLGSLGIALGLALGGVVAAAGLAWLRWGAR
ncbi:MAG TPA: glycerol-3-phosphate 1-O-acyltransferase PlsY [Gemmatimonadaceae bacterium]|nr:glycerol-3-phosphate 1-O-acyltransferase PlsY [Gemmatimonadaceae bacterium]